MAVVVCESQWNEESCGKYVTFYLMYKVQFEVGLMVLVQKMYAYCKVSNERILPKDEDCNAIVCLELFPFIPVIIANKVYRDDEHEPSSSALKSKTMIEEIQDRNFDAS